MTFDDAAIRSDVEQTLQLNAAELPLRRDVALKAALAHAQKTRGYGKKNGRSRISGIPIRREASGAPRLPRSDDPLIVVDSEI